MLNLAGADVDEVKIEKCYKVKIKTTTKKDGEKKTKNATCYVAKIKGDSNWYLAPYGDDEINNIFN